MYEPSLIVIGRLVGTPEVNDEESKCASRLVARSLPSVHRIDACAQSWPELVHDAVKGALDHGLDESALVLLLAHANAAPTPNLMQCLTGPLTQGASAACARSQHCPPPGLVPDYLTLRGLARYARALAIDAVAPCKFEVSQPFAVLASVGNLRSGAWAQRAVWAPGAYVHDFSGYRGGRREEVIALVPDDARRVLDVGGGEGGFLAELKAQRAAGGCETHLVEMSGSACQVAATVVDKVWQGDFLTQPLPRMFDCITFLDVLEHATHPTNWLSRAKELLVPGGAVVLSIPNVGHWSVVADLLEGHWDYAPAGIHCITHLRFFTRSGVVELLEAAGFTPVRIEARRIEPPQWFKVPDMSEALTVDADSLSTYAFLVVARPTR